MKDSTLQPTDAQYGVIRERAGAFLDALSGLPVDHLAQLAATLCQAPIALIGLLDHSDLWLGATVGLSVERLPGTDPLSQYLMAQSTAFEGELDDHMADSQLGQECPVRFCAGAPILGAHETHVEVVCVLDTQVRHVSPTQVEALTMIAGQVASMVQGQQQSQALQPGRQAVADASREAMPCEIELMGLFTHSVHYIAMLDLDGQLLRVNPAMIEDMGGEPSASLSHLHHLLPSQYADDLRQAAQGVPIRREAQFETPAGALDLDYTITPVCQDDGRIHYLLFEGRNIGARKQIEAQLIRAKEQAEDAIRAFDIANAELERRVEERTAELAESNESLRQAKEVAEAASMAKSEFLANMSHELRTPLHGMVSFATLGLERVRTAKPERLCHYFSKIRGGGELLMRLLNKLLDLAKLEAGKMSFDFQLENLGPLLATIADEFQSLMSERYIKLDYTPPLHPILAVVDAHRFMQVVRNLLSNAVKFS